MIRRIVVRVPVWQCLAKMRLNVHVGIRVKFAHHFARESAAMVFHVSCHPAAFADLAVQTRDLGFGQRGDAVPVFRNAGRIQAIHFFPLALRVVFDERRLLRAVQHFEQAVQRHREPRNRPHDEVHRFDSALGISQLIRLLASVMHLIQHVHGRVVLDECVINVRAGFIQQRLPVFGQLFARPNSPFVQIREIQLY